MDQVCAECHFDYASVEPAWAAAVLRREVSSLVGSVGALGMGGALGSDGALDSDGVAHGATWTPLQYAGHVRDVLVIARERTLGALLVDDFAVTPMGRDERVQRGEYDALTPDRAATEIGAAAGWLADTWERLNDADWQRPMLYNYPESERRSVAWFAAHIVHEVVHHRRDIELG